jgi:uncharacterized membrane protein YgdD (TMEM256/DUF423 family)
MSGEKWVRIGAILGALAVTIGAFGAHGLKPSVKELEAMNPPDRAATERRLENFETGVRYHAYHALAIVGLGAFACRTPRAGRALDLAGWLFVAGIFLFSGALYGIGAGGPKTLGMVAPFGGIAMIAGWVAFAIGAPGSGTAQTRPL